MDILTNIIFLLVGALIGFCCNVIVAWQFAYNQFLSSTASHRIRMVVEATKDILAASPQAHAQRSRLRDQYRYSLGVMIDDLSKVFGRGTEGFCTDGPWPVLVPYNDQRPKDPMKDNEGEPLDRWSKFDRYVRPVVEDINPTSFLGDSWWLRLDTRKKQRLEQLTKLSQLCDQLESTISLLDAALEGTPFVRFENTNTAIAIWPKHEHASEIKQLTDEFRELHAAWRAWLEVAQ